MKTNTHTQGGRDGARGESLLDTWRGLVAGGAELPAVIDGDSGRVWSRGALDASAAEWLAAFPAGARAGLRRRRVVMAEPNGARWFQVFLGLLQAGAVPVLADSKEAAERIAVIARVTRAAAVWSEGRLVWNAECGVRNVSNAECGMRNAELGECGRGSAPLGGADASGGGARPAVKGGDKSPHSIRARVIARGRLRRGDLCLAKLTSGSTGAPRAIDFTHAQMLADGRQVCAAMGIGAGDLNLAVIPLGHSYGLGNLVVPLLEQGTPVLCAASPFPQALAVDCARWRPTVFPAVPTLLRALAGADARRGDFASLRLVISAGAPLPAEVAASFAEKFGRRVHGFYGTSETGGIAYDYEGGAAEAGAAEGRGVGRVIEGVSLRWGRGRRFFVESAAVCGRGSFSPPDKGELNARGELVLLGRAGRALKVAGRRVDPVEVENGLRALPGVRDAFVTAHPSRADALAAVVAAPGSAECGMRSAECFGMRSSDCGMTEGAAAPVEGAVVAGWRGELARRMAVWKIPDKILIVPAFPVTQRGKTDRGALAQMLARG